MKILGIEIKVQRRPSLSRDVIPGLQALIESLSEGQIALTAQVDRIRKDLEATRRKVYRDYPAGEEVITDQAPGDPPGALVLRPRDNHQQPVHEPRTGDPAENY